MTDPNDLKGQYSNPSGEPGREVLESMNSHHVPLWEFCLSHMPKGMDGSVLDIGCGGGGFLRRMSERYPFAMFFGVDISEYALGMTMKTNQSLVDEGGLELHRASVESMSFVDGAFDLVTAMETYFFWPDLRSSMEEISRVTSAGGILVIGSEMRVDTGDEDYVKQSLEDYGAKLVRDSEMVSIMESCGFDVRMFTQPENRWVVFVGSKRT